ncbi:unnamed protein product [Cylicocyclus nassatus]|uniref:Uncharacterized protein n=1 Tax=Cylicocyclus nassatus TaxID=53992 RepID=A0AA36DNB6_CYLNA|nr:unnamed protein product [Cylicocyclus nassatus]
MAYFRTVVVVVLVQVLSVLADDDNIQSGGDGTLGDTAPGGGDDYDYGEELEWKDCETDLGPLNRDLGNVFGEMVGGVTFKVDCREVDAAEEFVVGGYVRYGEKTHFNLRDNTTEFTKENVISHVKDQANQWGVKLREALKEVGIRSGDVFFGCTWATKEVFCYYRKQDVNIDEVEEKLANLVKRLQEEFDKEKEARAKKESDPEIS